MRELRAIAQHKGVEHVLSTQVMAVMGDTARRAFIAGHQAGFKACHEELLRQFDDSYDPTPWCHGCGAMKQADCHCGRIAKNQ